MYAGAEQQLKHVQQDDQKKSARQQKASVASLAYITIYANISAYWLRLRLHNLGRTGAGANRILEGPQGLHTYT